VILLKIISYILHLIISDMAMVTIFEVFLMIPLLTEKDHLYSKQDITTFTT
jgi:hypothetical protein